jgi:hypothetical protein
MPLRFYRVVQSSRPTLDDFRSNKAKGIPMARPDPEVALLWDGISVNATEAQAKKRARIQPYLGTHIAELAISEGDPITVRRTGTSRGHYTLWGSPSELLARVIRVLKA